MNRIGSSSSLSEDGGRAIRPSKEWSGEVILLSTFPNPDIRELKRVRPSIFVILGRRADESHKSKVADLIPAPSGQGLRNALVTITDASGNRRTTTTGSFGIYTFKGLANGQTYRIDIESKRYSFTPRSITIADSLADIDFAAME